MGTSRLNQITLYGDGTIGVQWLKQMHDENGQLLFSEPHRTAVAPDGDIDTQLDAVFAHLDVLGYPCGGEGQTRMRALAYKIDAAAREDTEIEATRAASASAPADEDSA